jgi:hypothetical protein
MKARSYLSLSAVDCAMPCHAVRAFLAPKCSDGWNGICGDERVRTRAVRRWRRGEVRRGRRLDGMGCVYHFGEKGNFCDGITMTPITIPSTPQQRVFFAFF